MRLLLILVGLSLLLACAPKTEANDVDDWVSGVSDQAFDFGSKLSKLHIFGRLGISTNEFASGPLSLIFADLKPPLQPARSELALSIDIGQNEIATAIVQPSTNASNVCYLVLSTGSQSIIRKYNVSYTVEERIETRVNFTEVPDEQGVITVVNYGNYTVRFEDLIPNLQRTAAPNQVQNLPLIETGALDEAGGQGYFVSTSIQPSLCRVALSTMTLETCLDLGSVGAVLDIHIDSARGFVYILTSGSNLLRYATSSPLVAQSIQTLSLSSRGIVQAAVFETQRSNLMLASVASTTDALFIHVDLTSFTISPSFNLSIQSFSAPRAAAVDAQYGFAYFASFSNPAIVAKINLKTLALEDTHISTGAQSRATSLTLRGDGRGIFVIDFSNLFIVNAPAPCPRFCSGHGACQYGGECICDSGWQDRDCGSVVCLNGTDPTPGATNRLPSQCSSVGVCNNGTCGCFPGYSGPACSVFECPRGCSGRGTCNVQTNQCTCNRGFNGTGCEFSLEFLPCEQASSCDECGRNPQCVWCASNSRCINGNIQGPSEVFCADWHFRTCPQVAFTAVAAALTLLWAIFFVVNVVSAVIEDFGGDSSRAKVAERSRAAWWRELRSHDSWRIVETFQYVGLFSALNTIGLPSYFLQYSRVFQWAVVAARPIWESGSIFDYVIPSTASAPAQLGAKRSILSWIQVAHTTGTNPSFLVIGCIIIWAIITAILAIARLILEFAAKKNPIRDRCVHAIIRVALFFQIPLAAFGAAAIVFSARSSNYWAGLAIGVITTLVWLAAPIVVIIILKRMPAKTLLSPANKVRLGALVVPYNFRKVWFAGLPLMKKTIIALLFGFLASESPAACLGISIAISVAYGALCIFSQVFIEFSSLMMELAITALEIVMWALCFGIIQVDPSSALSIIIAVLHAAAWFVGAITYIIHWLRYKNVHSVGQLLKKEGK